MDLISAVLGANMTEGNLTQNGQIGYKDGWSITWNGNTDGLAHILVGEATLYKVSSRVLSEADVIGSKVVLVNDDGYKDNIVMEEGSALATEDGRCVLSDAFVSALAAAYDIEGLTFNVPETGTYFVNAYGTYAESMSKEIIHPIDPKFLPGVWLRLTEHDIAGYLSGDNTALSVTINASTYEEILLAAINRTFKGVIASLSDGTEVTMPAQLFTSSFDKNGGVFMAQTEFSTYGSVLFGLMPNESGAQLIVQKMG